MSLIAQLFQNQGPIAQWDIADIWRPMANLSLSRIQLRWRGSMEWFISKRSPRFGKSAVLSVSSGIIITAEWATSGIQARLHVTQLRRERTQSNSLRKCPHPRNDACDASVPRICSHASKYWLHAVRPNLLLNHTQVRFSLSSSPVFSISDTVTDSERFYNSIVELFEDPEEQEEVNALVTWWNRQVKLLIYFYHSWHCLPSDKYSRTIRPRVGLPLETVHWPESSRKGLY